VSKVASSRGKVIAGASIAAAVILAVMVAVVVDRRPRTHDARIFAYSAAMAPEVSGRIVKVFVANGEDVAEGAPLIEIDPAPYEFQLRQSRAQVAALKAQIALTGRQVVSQGSGVQAAESQVRKARDQLRFAQLTVQRLEPLVAPGYATQQQLDEARTNAASAQAALNALVNTATEARQAVGDTDSLEAQLEGAEAVADNAARNLRMTTLKAPFAGRVTGLQIAAGTFAAAGGPLFSLIKSDTWYAIADFRETELPHIAVGDRVTVWTMAESNVALEGWVESLGAGVQSTDRDGPGLPVLGRDLNWVVVAQRFPVWVRLEHPGPAAMHVGMTASVKVHHAGAL